MPVITKATVALRPISETSTMERLSLHLQNPMHTGGQLRLRASISAVTLQVRARQLRCHLQLEVPPPYPRNVNHDRTGVFPSDAKWPNVGSFCRRRSLNNPKSRTIHGRQNHMTQRTRSGLYPCLWGGDCNRTFSRPFDRNRHMQTHWPKEAEPRFECPEAKTLPWCDRTGANAFTREDHRDQHRRKVHKVRIPPKPRGLRGKLQGNGLRDRAIDGNSPASERTR